MVRPPALPQICSGVQATWFPYGGAKAVKLVGLQQAGKVCLMLMHKVDRTTGRNLIYWAGLSKSQLPRLYDWLNWAVIVRFRGP